MEAVRWRLLRGVAHFLGREGLILKERGVRQRGGPPRRVVSETLSGEVEVVVLEAPLVAAVAAAVVLGQAPVSGL